MQYIHKPNSYYFMGHAWGALGGDKLQISADRRAVSRLEEHGQVTESSSQQSLLGARPGAGTYPTGLEPVVGKKAYS